MPPPPRRGRRQSRDLEIFLKILLKSKKEPCRRADVGYDFRFFAEEFGLVGECDERDVAEIDALLRAHAAEEVSVVEA